MTGITLLCGGCEDAEAFNKPGVKLIINDKLNYLFAPAGDASELEKMYGEIKNVLAGEISKDQIIHAHNLNLGKNPVVTAVVSSMAREGYNVFNHCHDFAEDRPANMEFLREVMDDKLGMELGDTLYPDVDNYLYGTLNDYDLNRLGAFGVETKRRFILPNPVNFEGMGELPGRETSREEIVKTLSLDPGKLIVTYPVRVIERKNIGEFLLLATLFAERASWLVTLPPQNPVEVGKYNKWTSFIEEKGIDVNLEVGKKLDFLTILRGSDFCITTSYREGFGMVYLEPWVMGTPVTGRDIPYLTSDFRNEGLHFPNLYDRLVIPGTGEEFSDLSPDRQREIISKVIDSTALRNDILDANEWLKGLLGTISENTINDNIDIIKKRYSLEQYGERLVKIYQAFPGGK